MHRMQITHVLLAHDSGSLSLCLFANCAGGTGQWGGLHNPQKMVWKTTAVKSIWALYAHLFTTLYTFQGLTQVAAPRQLVCILKGLVIGKQNCHLHTCVMPAQVGFTISSNCVCLQPQDAHTNGSVSTDRPSRQATDALLSDTWCRRPVDQITHSAFWCPWAPRGVMKTLSLHTSMPGLIRLTS